MIFKIGRRQLAKELDRWAFEEIRKAQRRQDALDPDSNKYDEDWADLDGFNAAMRALIFKLGEEQ